ncbi:MAG: T9SS type A sorting domain-containing protein, partial [Bacteroidales bacterium]|nr:T9SS type A sorting domain-containing protein [Bacteroidales bacterium]
DLYLNNEIIEGEESNSIYASTDGEYYCVVFNDVDTVSTDIFILTISIPVVEFDEDTHYCINWEATLDAGEFESYLWNTGDDTQIISADTSGTYIVEVTDIHGCVGTGEISLTFDLDWELDYPSKVTLCEGDSVTLTMPDADTWIWSTGENTQSITLDQAGTINVTVVQGNCISEAEIKIESSINPPAIDLGPDRYLCNGDEIELQSPTYASQYRWDLNGEVVSTTNKVEVIEEGLYSLTIFNSAGCSEYDEINVFYNDYLIINIGDSINSCEGQEIKLSPGEVDSLVWDNGTEVDSLIVTTNGWYYVTVVDDLGCIGQDSAYVFFNELPEISIGNDTAFCDGNELEIIAPEAELYLWNTEDSTQSIVVNESGSYTVTITDTNGCQNSDSKVLTVWDNPFIDLGPDKTITEDQTIILGAEPGHPDYAWSTGETSDFIVINGLAYGIGEHLITLTVISDNGCENYDEVLITIIEGVGISTNLTDAISIYPNPADQIINIELNKLDDFVGLEIINIEGKVIYENNKDKDLELDIENWQSGVYFVKIVTEKEIGVLKFIKN